MQTVRKGGLTVRGRGHPRRSVEIVGGLRCDHHHQLEDVQHAVCPAPCLHRRAREHLTVAIPMVSGLWSRKFFDCFSQPKHFPRPRVRFPWPTRPREPGEIAQLRAEPAGASALYYAPPLRRPAVVRHSPQVYDLPTFDNFFGFRTAKKPPREPVFIATLEWL